MNVVIKVVSEDNISVCVGAKIGYVTAHYDEKGKRNYELIIGEIKSIKLGKRKQTVEINGFYPLDVEVLCTDIHIFKDWLSRNVIAVDTYFIADKETTEHVKEWIELAKNKSEKELSLLSSLEIEMDESEDEE